MDGSGPLPGVSATATGTIELAIRPEIGIYDVAGPNIEADADLTADVNFLGSPYFTLTPSITLKTGLDFDIADGLFQGSLEVTLGTFDFPSFVIASAPNATLAISPANPTVFPGTPTTFTTTRSDGKSYPVTWHLQGAATGDKITGGGVLTTVNPSGRTLTVLAQDSTGAVGQTTVTVGAPFDPVGDLSVGQASNSLDGDVSWNPPATTGGSPIASYTVTTSNGIATQSTTGTGVTLTGLHPGITYVITVYPVNTQGQTGPPASTTLQVIPVCTDTFTGTKSDAWTTAANWSGDYVPGPGDWVCDGGASPTLSSSTSVEGLQLSGVTLSIGSGDDLTVSNTATMNGTLDGPGTLTLPAGATMTIETSYVLEGGATLVNDGSATVEAKYANDFTGSSTFENFGTLAMTDNSTLGYNDTGTDPLVNEPGATVTYDSESGSGDAYIYSPVTDDGAVNVGAGGTLSVPSFAPATTSSTTIAVSRKSEAKISVSGTANPKGALAIQTADGYLPPVGSKLSILTASSLRGKFSAITGLQINSTEEWAVSYKSTSLVLTAVSE
jgi:hypothetical protein